jgi:hypothetical protein
MYYTGIDPRTMEPVYVAKDPHEKALQRAMLQWKKPQNRRLVLEALRKTGRTDLIGYGKECLVRPDGPAPWERERQEKRERQGKKGRQPERGRQERSRGGRPAQSEMDGKKGRSKGQTAHSSRSSVPKGKKPRPAPTRVGKTGPKPGRK